MGTIRARTFAWLVPLALQSLAVVPASAQTTPDPQRHRFEAAVGGLLIAGASLGSERAEVRANRVTPTPFTLFATDSRLARGVGLDGRIGYWLLPSLAVEGGFVRTTPHVQTRISADAEGAPALTVEERLEQYFIDVSAVWLINRFRFGEHTVPFVSGGAGYLRQLHEGLTFVETGQVFNVGGGLRHRLRQRGTGWIRGVGARVDGRVYVLVDGVQLEDGPRTHGAFSGSLFVTF